MMAVDVKRLDAEQIGPTDRQVAQIDRILAGNQRRRALTMSVGDSPVEQQWHALRVRPGSEASVGTALAAVRDGRLAPWYPVDKVRTPKWKTGGTIERERPAMKGYVYAHLPWCAETCHWLIGIEDVTGIVGGWMRPNIIREREMVEIKDLFMLTPKQRRQRVARDLRAGGIAVGDDVTLKGDALAGQSGTIVGWADAVSAWVRMKMFGGEISARVHLANLERSA